MQIVYSTLNLQRLSVNWKRGLTRFSLNEFSYLKPKKCFFFFLWFQVYEKIFKRTFLRGVGWEFSPYVIDFNLWVKDRKDFETIIKQGTEQDCERNNFAGTEESDGNVIQLMALLIVIVTWCWSILWAIESLLRVNLLWVRRVSVSRLFLWVDWHQVLKVQLFFLLAFTSETDSGSR